MNEVYIAGYTRTAFSRSRPNDPERDIFNSIRMDDALGMLIKEIVKKSGVNTREIGDVITGSALQAGENWLYGGRHPALLAGLPFEVPSMAMDRACASSLNAIAVGAMEIMTDNSDIVIAGGMEHMTHVPLSNNNCIEPCFKLMLRPEYMHYGMSIGYNMGLTAEKLSAVSGIGKTEMDQFSVRSHKLAGETNETGWFKGEITPVEVEYNGSTVKVDTDQSIRKDTTIEQISKLPPAFKPDGVITAGNSSPLNAGATAMMLMSEKKIKEYGVTPLGKITGMAWAGVEPDLMGKGPVPASNKLLNKLGLKVEDIDYWEINEAFAVVPLYAAQQLNIDIDRINVHGGAVAIGHPLGATGVRLAGTVARILNDNKKERAIATLCVGGGQGFSIAIERC
ncbi:MAG: acetyl-CoA C-acetyltransferase [Candidatus Thermoplasmatota archaeon]|nr:acetyl-CoA C-acetyltransferase [Candidatus Thermoplasmatota archaeon]MCL5964112.1 acetyl-CoA C-acetyltransferase [Candidatus Thermoplasmatota archaeon]